MSVRELIRVDEVREGTSCTSEAEDLGDEDERPRERPHDVRRELVKLPIARECNGMLSLLAGLDLPERLGIVPNLEQVVRSSGELAEGVEDGLLRYVVLVGRISKTLREGREGR